MDFSAVPSRYVFDGESFSGGQGNVYTFRDTVLDRRVAIKEMAAADQTAILHEVEMLKDVTSKHVVELYDVLIDASLTISGLVVEYVPGDDLSSYASDSPDDIEYLKTLYQIATGIADLHSCGKVHRDIKPINMKRDSEGLVKIFDLGLSQYDQPNAATMAAKGTHGYRAPELYAAPPAKYGKAVDTYAFGAVCWWLRGGDLPQALEEIPPQSTSSVPSIAASFPSIPDDIASIIDAALQVEPERRPLMADVRDVLARRLLFGRHRAHLSSGDHEYDLQSVGQGVRISRASEDSVSVVYDGLRFAIKKVIGNVYVNNRTASDGQELPGSSVITLGTQDLGNRRTFVTFDISHPEVVL